MPQKILLLLVGLSQHATKVAKPGRTFISRMYAPAARMKKLSHLTRLALVGPVNYILVRNQFSVLLSGNFISSPDASGTWACGARFGDQWFQFPWPIEWKPITTMTKALVPIIFSCSRQLSRKRVQFFCDNLGLVKSIQKDASKDEIVHSPLCHSHRT